MKYVICCLQDHLTSTGVLAAAHLPVKRIRYYYLASKVVCFRAKKYISCKTNKSGFA